jgi:hypothetical protein
MTMPEYKHKWLLECAKLFGMSVSEFAKCIGYSRQALYQANEGVSRLEPGRLAVSQYKLEEISKKMHEEERAKADENFIERNKMIDVLFERLSG